MYILYYRKWIASCKYFKTGLTYRVEVVNNLAVIVLSSAEIRNNSGLHVFAQNIVDDFVTSWKMHLEHCQAASLSQIGTNPTGKIT